MDTGRNECMILDKARELGIALSESAEFLRMQHAREIMDANEAVVAVLDEYKTKQDELVDLLSGEDPDRLVVAGLSRDVETLQEQLLENPVFAEAMAAQSAFQLLMNQVNGEIAACIGAQTGRSGCGGGSCEGCKGCH